MKERICPICKETILVDNVCPKCTKELCSPLKIQTMNKQAEKILSKHLPISDIKKYDNYEKISIYNAMISFAKEIAYAQTSDYAQYLIKQMENLSETSKCVGTWCKDWWEQKEKE